MPIKGAEIAIHVAPIRVVDVAINYIGDYAVRVFALTNNVSRASYRD